MDNTEHEIVKPDGKIEAFDEEAFDEFMKAVVVALAASVIYPDEPRGTPEVEKL